MSQSYRATRRMGRVRGHSDWVVKLPDVSETYRENRRARVVNFEHVEVSSRHGRWSQQRQEVPGLHYRLRRNPIGINSLWIDSMVMGCKSPLRRFLLLLGAFDLRQGNTKGGPTGQCGNWLMWGAV